MSGTQPPTHALLEQLDAVLHAGADAAPLAATLADLVAAPDPASSLGLAAVLHTLVGAPLSLDTASRPPAQRVSAFLHDALFPAVTARGGDTHRAALADALIDVAWQLDQEVDTRVAFQYRALHPPAPPPPAQGDAQAMQVEAQAQKDAERQKNIAAEVQAARRRLAEVLRALIDAGDLPKRAVGERVDPELLGMLNLVPDNALLRKMEIRQRTALYYKQQKFNLLREESEGYSKLVVELLSSMGPPHSTEDGTSRESEAQRSKRAQSAIARVKNLIGNFDLDPSRTLDVFLDTFSDHVVEHHQFFLDFLAASPWAPKARTDAAIDAKGKSKEEFPVSVGLEHETGNDTIAQILGFKFAFYQKADAPTCPPTLYLTAALLIWHGFVKLTDLWAHLSPADADLAKLETKWRDEQAALARSVGGANALAMAGALVDDEAPAKPGASSSTAANGAASTSASAAAAAPPRDLPNQKLDLLRALLTVGDVTHSFFLLAQYPFLPHAFADISALVTRLMHASLAPAYAPLSPQRSQYASEFSAPRTTRAAVKRVLTADAHPDLQQRASWTFFFPRWRERVPRAGDAEEAVALLEKVYLPLVGVGVASDFTLYTKIVRIAVADLGSDPKDHPRRQRWLDLLRVYLVPGVSLLSSHIAAGTEVWRVLSLFPIETRFTLYGEWKDVHYRRNPALGVRKAEAERDIKSILRRLSTDNAKKLGKAIACVAQTNPTAVFSVTLNQVQSYDNLIIPVVEALRYASDLSYDVLAYSILDSLSSSRPKTKDDGTSIAMWLSGLATFTGQVYRRWAAMQPSLWLILQYLVNQLVLGNSKDLVVLRELIARMTSIEPFADLSDAQVLSLAGGKHLRNEVYLQTDLSRAGQRGVQDALAKARQRLKSALLDTGLAMPLLVNIALQRQACLKTDAHLKSLGALFDQNHAVLFQFTELLAALASPDELARLVPDVEVLLDAYKLDAGVAFDLARPKLRARLREHDEREARELAEHNARKKQGLLAKLAREREKAAASGERTPAAAAAATAEGDDVKMEDAAAAVEAAKDEADGEIKQEGGTPPPPAAAAATNGTPAPAASADMAEAPSSSGSATPAPTAVEPWHPGLVDAISKVSEILPEEARATLGAPFFVTFWQLTLHDILYPKERYDAEITRLKMVQRDVATLTGIKPEDKAVFVESVIATATGLTHEAGQHLAARQTVTRRLTREKANWFPNVKTKADRIRLADEILQYCVQPRARLSLPDAVYSYQIVKRLHSLNTPSFHTIIFFDRLLTSQISPVLYSCTENEARNYGRFLYEVLGDLHRWQKDKGAYAEEAIGAQLSGFLRKLAPPLEGKTRQHYEHAEFQAALLKWHGNMVLGFVESFKSAEYMHIKNSILVLTKIAPYFPLDHKQGSELERSVNELLAVEKREDLTILAQGYKAVLNKSRKQWINKPEPTPAPATSKSASPAVSTKPAPAAASRSSATPAASTSSAAPVKSARPPAPSARSSQADVKPSPPAPSSSRPPADPPRRSDPPASSSQPPRSQTNGSLEAAEKLRQEALASKRAAPAPSSSTAKMDPPRAPAASSSSAPRRGEPSRPPSRATSPRRDARDSRDVRDARDARDSRDARDARDTRDARDSDRSRPRSPVRSRSVESSHSRTSRGGDARSDRDTRETRDARDARDSRDDRRNSDRTSDRGGGRMSDRDRERERERDREKEKERERDREKEKEREKEREREKDRDGRERDRRDGRDERAAGGSRRDERASRPHDDRYKSTAPSGPTTTAAARRVDDRSRRDERPTESHRDRRGGDRTKMSREAEQREAEKEKERQRDREREEAREKAKRERDANERRNKEEERGGGSARSGLPPKPSAGSGTGDRLRPAPAHRQQSESAREPAKDSLLDRARAGLPGAGGSASASPAPVEARAAESPRTPADEGAFSIKGRGSRVYQPLKDVGSDGTSRRGDDASRKRPAGSLADRLAPESPKRARRDESRDGSREPRGNEGRGGGRRR
ncbi:hypothetical protein Rhopal_003781-T1 [Rhodotorula paludigena]|uniref:THO complex subunit 2 n=1 Tax=Rhodotorula paludigena TaxID=86838 RepID=A0AAV5GMQ1_9BASI|nr:hypothetical protein Rhopal_003781-T1 [Rhodotorula paludigena]